MTDRRVEDLAILVRRFAHATRQNNSCWELREQAMDYLKRHGLAGGPMRSSNPQTINANENSCYWCNKAQPTIEDQTK